MSTSTHLTPPVVMGEIMSRADEVRAIVRAHHGTGKIAVFGSQVTGKATKESDIDLLVEFGEGTSLLDVVAVEAELSELFGRPVDIMSFRASGYAADHARRQAVLLV